VSDSYFGVSMLIDVCMGFVDDVLDYGFQVVGFAEDG